MLYGKSSGVDSMRFRPVKFKTLFLLAVIGFGGWQTHQYLAATEDHLVAIDTKTGQILWNRRLSKQNVRFDEEYYPLIPLSSDRLLLTDFLEDTNFIQFLTGGRPDKKTACFWSELDQASGELVWRKSLKEMGLDGCPISYTNGVAQDGQLYTFWKGRLWDVPDAIKRDDEQLQQAIVAMDFKNHQVRWVSPIQSQKLPMQYQRRLDAGGHHVLAIRSNQIFAGMEFDNAEYADEARKSINVPYSGMVLKGLDIATGNVIWRQNLGGRSYARLNYNDSFVFSKFSHRDPRSDLQLLSSHNMETGKLEAVSQEVNVEYLFQYKGDIYTGIDANAIQKFVPRPGKHILDSPPIKLPIQPRSCSRRTLYPSQNHLLGLCKITSITYDDPESYQLFALDDRTGKQQWQLHIPSDSRFFESGTPRRSIQPQISVDTSGKRLFLPTVFQDPKSRHMVAQIQSITIDDGQPEWRLPIELLEQPVVSSDRLFVITRLPHWQTWPITRPKPLKS
jgi:outer membrane protein assembly factor BamB